MLPTSQPMRMSKIQPTIPCKPISRRRPLLVSLLIVMAIVAGCKSDGDGSASLTDHDVDVLAGLERHTSLWNETVAPFVRDYTDPNVDADTWATAGAPQLKQMRGIVVGLDSEVLGISDAGVRAVLTEIVDNYKEKLSAATRLVNAVAAGDSDAEQAAASDLQAAAEAGRRLAEALLDRLRPFIDPDELSRRLRDKGAEIERLLAGG